MDNLCHTLAGAALGEAGLKRRTAYGNATLMIAANMPDIDVLAFATSTPAVALRRGWTHGIFAQLLLPVLLAAIVYVVARRRDARIATPDANSPPHSGHGTFAASHLRTEPRAHFGWLLTLSYIGIYSHVGMDLMNNYGLRLLAPLDWRWFYGDAVFIIDPWLWLSLSLGIWMTRRRGVTRAAQIAVVVASLYIAGMVTSARVARAAVSAAWLELRGTAPRALMVGPVPVTPMRRAVIIDAGAHYETGTFSWPGGELRMDATTIPKNDADPRVAAARTAPNIAAFLVWSRFPYYTLEETGEGTRVTVGDVRFVGRGAFDESVVVPW